MSSNPDLDAANKGALRPPILCLAAIVLGLALQGLRPLELPTGGLGTPLGLALIAVAFLLFRLATREFRQAGTSLRGSQPSSAVVSSGPYRFSRNPVYLSMALLQFGIALSLENLWSLVTLCGFVAAITGVVIPREERYLEREFGAMYLDYKSSVRRWI